MASYHVREAAEDGSSIQVVFHIATPIGANLAGKTWTSCLVEDAGWPKTSVLANISAAEQVALNAGTLVEKVISFETHRDVPNATKQVRLDQRYLDTVTRVQQEIKNRYWAWGYERTV